MTLPLIAVAGIGYVGIANAVFLSKFNHVNAYDINPDRQAVLSAAVDNAREQQQYSLLRENAVLTFTTDPVFAFHNADYVVIATPTNYDEKTGTFDTSSIEDVIQKVRAVNSHAVIVIRSTVPIGYTRSLREALNDEYILFSPEFLRETHMHEDMHNPSRIIVSPVSKQAGYFMNLLAYGTYRTANRMALMSTDEAEAVKLFSNAYLAMRVAFFNELDAYAICKGLNTKTILQGVCADPRIGEGYNNPSFGYGGYCLPKDTKQLANAFEELPAPLIEAIVESNICRKGFMAYEIENRVGSSGTVGVYRLVMKEGSDNIRESSVIDVIRGLKARNVNMLIYEPLWSSDYFEGIPVARDLTSFKRMSDVIIANRNSPELADVPAKLYTRDVFGAG